MQAYRYRITPKSPMGTPLRSDTLMGQCLWAAALLDGEQAVTELIQEFESEEPPFILSSGFPADMVPMPVLPSVPSASGKGTGAYRQGKQMKDFAKLKWLGLDVWRECRHELSLLRLFQHWHSVPDNFSDEGPVPFLEPHNTIDRRSDSVLEGGFFFTESQLPGASRELDVYAKTSDPERLDRYLDFVCQHGYGKDTSIGRGHLDYRRLDEDVSDLFQAEGTHSMLLSVFSASDLSGAKGYYKPFVKRGRVWEPAGRTPFKKPVLAFEEGSVFSGLPQASYVLRNIHSDERVVQIMWPLGMSCTIKEES